MEQYPKFSSNEIGSPRVDLQGTITVSTADTSISPCVVQIFSDLVSEPRFTARSLTPAVQTTTWPSDRFYRRILGVSIGHRARLGYTS